MGLCSRGVASGYFFVHIEVGFLGEGQTSSQIEELQKKKRSAPLYRSARPKPDYIPYLNLLKPLFSLEQITRVDVSRTKNVRPILRYCPTCNDTRGY